VDISRKEYDLGLVHRTCIGKEGFMRGRRYSQPLGNCVWLAIPILVGSHTFLAETVKPSPATAIAAMMQGPALQNATISTMPSEAQGDLLMVNGNYVAAIEAYRQSSLRSAATWNKIGVAYHHLFALEEARKNYQMALTLNPRYPDALNNLAAVYQGERNYKKAEKTYKRALKYGPDSAVAYRNLGTAYFSEGNYKEGAKAYRKAVELNPNSFDADRTEVMEEKLSRRQRVAISYSLAKAYAMAGKNELALIYLRKAMDAGFNDRRLLMEDKEFTQLRATPEFQQLIVAQHLD
jgi:tetratricopeptide (TPR) repeat protein